jgi:hypothetical protein
MQMKTRATKYIKNLALAALLMILPASMLSASWPEEWSGTGEGNNDYYCSTWYGWFYSSPADDNYNVYSYNQGWQYVWFTSTESNVYLYDFGTESWWWTSSTDFPLFYEYNNATWYLWYSGHTNPNRTFYNYTSGKNVTEAQIKAGQ